MKRLLCSFVLLALALPWAGALAAPKADAGGAPPLIDRELFFGDPLVSGAQLSPDGKYVSFIKQYKEVRNIWVKTLDAPFDQARPVTADKRPIPGYFWSRDGQRLLYVQDKGGNENFHVYAVDPSAAAEADTGVPPARDLTPLENVRAAIYAVPKNTPNEILVGLNDRDAEYHDVYRIDLTTGERTLLIKNTEKIGGYVFDLAGQVRLAIRPTPGGGGELLRVDGDQLTQLQTWTYEEDVSPFGFTPDNKGVYMTTSKGADVDLSRLVLLDPATGAEKLVETDPERQVDFGGAVFAPDTDELIATTYVGDRTRIYPREKRFRKAYEFLRKRFPDGDLGIASVTRDMRLMLVGVDSDVDPGSVWLYEFAGNKLTLQYRSRPELPSEQLAYMKPVRYKARDGLEIPAYLTLPRGVPAKNLPVIIHPHGGPWARDYWGYSPFPQFLANRGYAVLQPNFRSSDGYGKKFLNAGNHEWGTGAMQHDLTDAVQWLIREGIADPQRVAIFGGSYGGYATLAGVAFTPDLYACGVPYVAPSNLITLMESFPAYWRPFLEGSWYKRVGDPANEKDRADLIARSPLFKVDAIRVPLLVVHGANDPRVKQAESDRIVVALRDKGAAVEYLVAPDEGHGFRSPENRLALAASMETFLAKHLGGRCQETMTDKVAKRLAEITVDVKSVKMPDDRAAAAAANAPLPVANGALLKPLALRYKGAFAMGPQKLDLDLNRAIDPAVEGGRSLWRVIEATKMAMGTMADTTWVDRATLRPVRRSAGGMGTMALTYGESAITGKVGGGGQMLDINVTLKAPAITDGAALDAFLSCLPLTDGYTATLQVFDSAQQRMRPLRITVKGRETTTATAGAFPTFVLDLAFLDGDPAGSGTVRLLQSAPHHVVSGEYKLPASMGGGQLTLELTAMP